MSPVFDEAKYRALLEKLEVSEVNIADMDLNDRIDAEYFKRDSLMMLEKLRQLKNKKLEHFGDFVASAFYPAATQLYAIGDTPFIRCVDCINFPLMTHEQDSLFEKIPMDFVSNNGGINILHQGDIVITKVGSPCFASIIHEHEIVALSRTVLGIKGTRNIDPYYLLVFLRSNYGFKQLLRQRELTIQYQLTLERVKQILVYTPSNILQNLIKTIVLRTFSFKQKSHDLYLSAQNLLLQELGLTDWQPDDESVATKTFADFQNSGRLDAEYYQPKYEAIAEKLTQYSNGTVSCENILVNAMTKLTNGTQYCYLELADIGKSGEINSCTHDIAENLPSRARQKVKTNDVIVSSVEGSLTSCALITEEYNNAICSTGFHVLRSAEINPETLLLLMKSSPIQALLKQGCSGTILTAILPDALKAIKLPLIRKEVQNELAAKVQESFALRKESKRLLELAKHAVEVAIEQGEDAAMKLLEENI